MSIGTVHTKPYFCLHRQIGTATDQEEQVVLQCQISEPTGYPVVRHEDGRTFVLSWDDILKLAQEAFNAEGENDED